MFVPIPVQVDDGRERTAIPVANGVLIALNVLIFCLGWHPVVGPGTNILATLTYSFGHASVSHLAWNMLALLVFGTPANRRLGNGWYLMVYLGSAMTLGMFAWLFLSGGMIGASGAIFSIMAVVALLLPSARITIFYFALFPVTLLLGLIHKPETWVFWFIRWDTFKIRAVWGLFFIPFLELWSLFCLGWNWTNLGHLFGMVCGVAAVLLLPAWVTIRRRRFA